MGSGASEDAPYKLVRIEDGRMALILLSPPSESQIVPKVNRRKTPRDTDRLKALQDQIDRLVAEGRQIRAQMDELRGRDELRELRKLLRKQHSRAHRFTHIEDDDPSSN